MSAIAFCGAAGILAALVIITHQIAAGKIRP
jgi:hypothetical protein